MGCSVIAIEYPGYGCLSKEIDGEKTLKPRTFDIKLLTRNVFQWITKDKAEGGLGHKKEQVIAWGRSLGTGPACLLAAENKEIKALILVSAYTSMREVAKNKVGETISDWLMDDHYDNVKSMKSISCPALFIHGKKDPLIPCSMSE